MKFLCGITLYCNAICQLCDTYYKVKGLNMKSENQKINIKEFIRFYCNHNNNQFKLIGDIVCAINNNLNLRIENNEIRLNCSLEELEALINDLDIIFLDNN